MYSSHTPFPKSLHLQSINKTCSAGYINSTNLLVIIIVVFVVVLKQPYIKLINTEYNLADFVPIKQCPFNCEHFYIYPFIETLELETCSVLRVFVLFCSATFCSFRNV